MREKALLFGESKSLVGIVTDPPSADGSERPGIIILNAGTLHRVGPNRLHVQIARNLAAEGFVALRFDHAGIGDSRASEDNIPFARRAVRETQEAMDFLSASRGIKRFLLLGICSGADNALQASTCDPRVVGIALIDGYNLPTFGLAFHVYAKRLYSMRSWGRLLTGRSELWSGMRAFVQLYGARRQNDRPRNSMLPSREEFVGLLQGLADRGVNLCLVYSAESPAYYNYRGTLQKKIRSWPKDRVRVEHLKDSDHVFTLRCNQERLVSIIHEWACGALGHAAALPAAPAGATTAAGATGLA